MELEPKMHSTEPETLSLQVPTKTEQLQTLKLRLPESLSHEARAFLQKIDYPARVGALWEQMHSSQPTASVGFLRIKINKIIEKDLDGVKNLSSDKFASLGRGIVSLENIISKLKERYRLEYQATPIPGKTELQVVNEKMNGIMQHPENLALEINTYFPEKQANFFKKVLQKTILTVGMLAILYTSGCSTPKRSETSSDVLEASPTGKYMVEKEAFHGIGPSLQPGDDVFSGANYGWRGPQPIRTQDVFTDKSEALEVQQGGKRTDLVLFQGLPVTIQAQVDYGTNAIRIRCDDGIRFNWDGFFLDKPPTVTEGSIIKIKTQSFDHQQMYALVVKDKDGKMYANTRPANAGSLEEFIKSISPPSIQDVRLQDGALSDITKIFLPKGFSIGPANKQRLDEQGKIVVKLQDGAHMIIGGKGYQKLLITPTSDTSCKLEGLKSNGTRETLEDYCTTLQGLSQSINENLFRHLKETKPSGHSFIEANPHSGNSLTLLGVTIKTGNKSTTTFTFIDVPLLSSNKFTQDGSGFAVPKGLVTSLALENPKVQHTKRLANGGYLFEISGIVKNGQGQVVPITAQYSVTKVPGQPGQYTATLTGAHKVK